MTKVKCRAALQIGDLEKACGLRSGWVKEAILAWYNINSQPIRAL